MDLTARLDSPASALPPWRAPNRAMGLSDRRLAATEQLSAAVAVGTYKPGRGPIQRSVSASNVVYNVARLPKSVELSDLSTEPLTNLTLVINPGCRPPQARFPLENLRRETHPSSALTLLVNSKPRGKAVWYTTFEGQRDAVHSSGETHSHGVGD